MPSTQHAPLTLSHKGSFFWNSITTLRPLFHSCSRFRIGSGKTISFWFDGWDGLPLSTDGPGSITCKGISLYEARNCDLTLLQAPLTLQQYTSMQKLMTYTPTDQDDTLLWTVSSSATFAVKSVYTILSQGGKTLSPVAALWKAKVTPTMRIFFFLLLNNRLLTHDVMQSRNLPHSTGCVMCSACPSETAMHLFFRCPFAIQVWSGLSINAGYQILTVKDTAPNTYTASAPADRQLRKRWNTLFITAAWCLWKERNERTFRQHRTPSSVIIARALQEADLYSAYC